MISQDAGCGQVPSQLLFPDLIPLFRISVTMATLWAIWD